MIGATAQKKKKTETIVHEHDNRIVRVTIASDDGYITSAVHTEVSTPTLISELKNYRINSRTADTNVRMRNGETLVIGGLMSVTDLDNLSGIPGLMNLPILGELFKFHNRSKTYGEVYIMLTPFIMDDSIDAREVARKVEY